MRFRACRSVVGFEPDPLSAFHHVQGVQQQREKSLEQAGKIAFFHYMDFVKTHFVCLCLQDLLSMFIPLSFTRIRNKFHVRQNT